jgi:hypothetical protein
MALPCPTSMVQATSPSPPSGRLPRQRPGGTPITWWTVLVLGFCFGLGYGFTQRLLGINPGDGWSGFQLFGVKAFPGTTLESLRERTGAQPGGIRADLDQIEREKQSQKQQRLDQEETARRRATLEERDRQEREKERLEAEQRSSEAFRESQDAVPEPSSPPIESPLLSPPEPVPAAPAPPQGNPIPADTQP